MRRVRNKLHLVKQTSQKITRACTSGDLESLLSNYDESERFIHVGNDENIKTFKEFRQVCENYYSKIAKQKVVTLKSFISRLSTSTYLESWEGSIKAYFKDGSTLIFSNVTVITMYEVKGKVCKVLYVHESWKGNII